MEIKKPIRILHVVTYMGRGGLETMLMNYYRHMDRDKVQFDFLVHRDFAADYDAEILSLGGRIYRLPKLNPVSIKYLQALDRFFEKHHEYRIVHSHLDCMAGIPLRFAKKHGIPVRIAHSHASSQTKDWKYVIKVFYKRKIHQYATNLFACSEAAGRWMFGKKAFCILHNAIDTKCFTSNLEERNAVRNELAIPADALVIGHVGRFATPKNHSFLLRVFARLPQNTRLLLVGDGELRNDTEKQAEQLGIRERVFFAGIRSDVNRLLQAMDVFAFPSLYEGLGIAAIEAQAAGLPCLISDGVPIACKVTDLVQQLPLAEEMWEKEIVAATVRQKENTYHQICDAGYDICANAAKLQSFYETV